MSTRPTRLLGTHRLGGAGLRVWEMRAAAAWPPAEILRAAEPLVEAFVADVPGAPGFILVHAARPAFFVLAHLWDGVDLCQRYWTAPLDDPTALSPHTAHGAIGCVWELEVIAAERDRWAAVCERPDAGGIYLSSD